MSLEGTAAAFLVRRFDPAHDFPALVHLLDAIDAVDHSGEATTEDQQLTRACWNGALTPAEPNRHRARIMG